MTSLLGYLESGISHPSLWFGAYDADHPALSLHYKNATCRSAADVNETFDGGTRQAFSNTGFSENKEVMPTKETNDATSQDTEEVAKSTEAVADQSSSQEIEEEPKKKEKQSNPAYTLFSKEQAKDLVEKTEERVQALLQSSALLQNKCLADRVPTFTLDQDISRGDMLGMGGFALIFRAQVKEPQRLLNHHQREQNKENCEYVLKHLSPDLINQERKLHIGMRDFVMEAYYMATLDHPHILKLVGASKGGIANFGVTLRTDAFFMVLPKLTCTLTEKLRAWKKEEEASRIGPKILENTNRKTYTRSWSSGAILARQRILRETELRQRQLDAFFHRLQVVIDLLSALEYLHSKRLFHRDIKPDNIGFDTEGCLKLFDFGLCRQLPPDEEAVNRSTARTQADLTFDLPGNTGTARYMAPEVILRQPYNCKVDVFASSILCWEVLSMERAYVTTGVPAGQFFKDNVAIYNDRPPLPKKWPRSLRKAIKQGWAKSLALRPTSSIMRKGLQKIVEEYRFARYR